MKKSDLRVASVVALIEANFHHRLTVSEMAESVNLSPWHLCHLFKAEMGVSPERYLTSVRLEEAKNLLEFSFLNVKQIILAVGISDASHFTKIFAATIVCLPAITESNGDR